MASIKEREKNMTSKQAYVTIKDLRNNGKKKFSEIEKRALEHALVLIAQQGFEEMLSRKEASSAGD